MQTIGRLRCAAVLAACVAGCSGDGAVYDEVDVSSDLSQWEPVTWDEFRAAAIREPENGAPYFVLEGDLPIKDEAELRDIYDALLDEQTPKAIVKTLGNNGSGGDDAWQNDEEVDLTYCVAPAASWPNGATETGAQRRTRTLQYMANAGIAWSVTARVGFRYVSAQDASCAAGNTGVRINVIPWVDPGTTAFAACAYWPVSGVSCTGTARSIGIDYARMPADDAGRTGLLMHEIGHVLGLHHEHEAKSTSGCVASTQWRVLQGTSTFDQGSIMGYSSCTMSPGNTLSDRDGIGMRDLYGAPAAWFSSYTLPLM